MVEAISLVSLIKTEELSGYVGTWPGETGFVKVRVQSPVPLRLVKVMSYAITDSLSDEMESHPIDFDVLYIEHEVVADVFAIRIRDTNPVDEIILVFDKE